jgi:hypothetical protein
MASFVGRIFKAHAAMRDVDDRLWASKGSHANARLQATREAAMAAFAKRLAAGVVLRSGSPLSGANRTTFAHFETYRF